MVLKRRLFLLCVLLLALPVGCARAVDKGPVPGYVRLHVVAASDSEEDQALKLEVRNAVLAGARALLGGCDGADEAWARVSAARETLEEVAASRARACGYVGPVRCETGVFPFPDRRYGDALLPAGDYRALRVVIGEGRGHNWWCVLFPSMCYPGDLSEGEPVRFYSSILNWLRGLLGGEGA